MSVCVCLFAHTWFSCQYQIQARREVSQRERERERQGQLAAQSGDSLHSLGKQYNDSSWAANNFFTPPKGKFLAFRDESGKETATDTSTEIETEKTQRQ